MSLKRALLATTLLAAPTLASAQPVSGLYIGVGAGGNWINNPSKFDISGNTVTGNFGLPENVRVDNVGKANFEFGWGGVVSIGWGFGNGFRAELEGNFRENEVDSIRGFGLAPVGRTGGFQRTYGAMVNVFYDFDLANFGLGQSIFQPYVGIGAGYAWTDWQNLRGQSANGLVIHSNDDDGQFAYQAIVGVATPLTWVGVRGLTLTAEYRFFGTLQPELFTTVSTPAGAIVRAGRIEADNYNHSVMLGLRYALFQPPPPPPPVVAQPVAPAPAPARTYLVFFDWDRADLTSRAREIIGEAATNSRRVQTTRIEVAGHADRSGTPQYNQRLSQRRADAVANELVARGIGRNEISVTAFGESRPLVPTADGVREPQNRRVEFVLR
ncbi:OmpA family protein [Siccirubricoccus sp. KC 17139]|uniref:OmpA family protein n=1 Tax=Siccirubricoccus soli TaxID=2899147 RepID=A0ABT1DCA1_9PROT|nr:OmpA family protein [Siccirubricoccus soli]MCO6419571.1 OmpA family protein [Siccirubricoccus soli]MCP2685706.1 OmpA family protein [Siccirubricoccus soli]